jgi:phosphatidate cytidylyltransferase
MAEDQGSPPFGVEREPAGRRRGSEPPVQERVAGRRPQPSGGSRGPRSETVARVAWALPWIAFVIVIVIVGGPLFAGAMAVLGAIGLIELFRMLRDAAPFATAAIAAVAVMVFAAYQGDHFHLVLAVAVGFLLVFAAAGMRPARDRAGVSVSIAVTVFGIVWVGIPFAHAVLLRELPDHGAALLVDVLVATFVADTAAYAGGRMFGSHRFAPSLSPNKTVEGLAFGFVGGTMGFWFAGLYQDWLPGIDALLMGMVVAMLAPAGDLFESLVKRDLGVKDSGNVFGPHGGLLDRVDAVMFTIVAGYYLSVAFVY